MIFYKSLNLRFIEEVPSRFDKSFEEVVSDLMILLWSKWCNDFSLLISFNGRVLKEFSDEWLFSNDFTQMSKIFQDNVQSFVFRCWGEQWSGISSGGSISNGWWFMTLIISVSTWDWLGSFWSEEESGNEGKFLEHHWLFMINL